MPFWLRSLLISFTITLAVNSCDWIVSREIAVFNVPKEEVFANFDFFYRPPVWKEFLALSKDDLHRTEFIDAKIARCTPSVSHQRILGLLFAKF